MAREYKKTSEMDQADPLTGDELVAIVQGGDKRSTLAAIAGLGWTNYGYATTGNNPSLSVDTAAQTVTVSGRVVAGRRNKLMPATVTLPYTAGPNQLISVSMDDGTALLTEASASHTLPTNHAVLGTLNPNSGKIFGAGGEYFIDGMLYDPADTEARYGYISSNSGTGISVDTTAKTVTLQGRLTSGPRTKLIANPEVLSYSGGTALIISASLATGEGLLSATSSSAPLPREHVVLGTLNPSSGEITGAGGEYLLDGQRYMPPIPPPRPDIETAPSLAVSNPNLFSAEQAAAQDKGDHGESAITQENIGGIPCWGSTGSIRQWGPFDRSELAGNIFSVSVNFLAITTPGAWNVRISVIQYSGQSQSSTELTRDELHTPSADFSPGIQRLESLTVAEGCQSIYVFIGPSSGSSNSVYYRDMLLAAGSSGVFRLPSGRESSGSKIIDVVSAGTGASQAATVPEYISYSAGGRITWSPSADNTGAMSLDINGLGAIAVNKAPDEALAPGDVRGGSRHLLQAVDVSGALQWLVVGTLKSDVLRDAEDTTLRGEIEAADSLAKTNPNLFSIEQASATDKQGKAVSQIAQVTIDGIPHWSSTGVIRQWGPFLRSELVGDTVSAAVRFAASPNPGAHPVRLLLSQYDSPSLSGATETDRQEILIAQDEFRPGFYRFEGVPIHPDTESFYIFIGTTSSSGGTVVYRDMLLAAGGSAAFRLSPPPPPEPDPSEARRAEVWVSPAGNDSASGDIEEPYATLTKAIEELDGEGTIYLLPGNYGSQQISALDVIDLKLIGTPSETFQRPTFTYGSLMSLTEVSGRTGVYQSPLPGDRHWLWVDGVPDAETLVPDDEQHGLLNGRAHRLESTKIWPIDAGSLASALDAIETSPTPVFWRDSSTNTAYMSLPAGSSGASTPVYRSLDSGQLIIDTRDKWAPQGVIEIVGIDVKYGAIDARGFLRSKFTDVSVLGAPQDGFRLANWCETLWCRAGGCGSANGLGDGFNAHDHAVWSFDSIYGHDNWDDGESTHENCRTTGQNSVMEYNGGGGFVPAYGAQEVLYNCTSRKNSVDPRIDRGKQGGFTCVGDPIPADPGVVTTLEAYSCISIGDKNGFYDGTVANPPASRRLLAVDCKVYDSVLIAYSCAEVRDCSQTGSTTVRGSGTVVKNTDQVS